MVDLFLEGTLYVPKSAVRPRGCQQFVMRPLLDDAALVQHLHRVAEVLGDELAQCQG